MNGAGFEILARTPVPKLPLLPQPPPPPPTPPRQSSSLSYGTLNQGPHFPMT